jgi:hypothetical protein
MRSLALAAVVLATAAPAFGAPVLRLAANSSLARDLNAPTGPAFHHFTVLVDGERTPIFVWNGVKSYRSPPSRGVMEYLASLAKPSAKHEMMMVQFKRLRTLSSVLRNLPDEFGSFMFWAKDNKTFHDIVADMRSRSVYDHGDTAPTYLSRADYEKGNGYEEGEE